MTKYRSKQSNETLCKENICAKIIKLSIRKKLYLSKLVNLYIKTKKKYKLSKLT